MLRSVGKTAALKTVRELDAFPKIPESYVETSPVGGTFSVVMCVLIIWLLVAEISYYFDSRFVFKFLPDTDYDAKLKVNIDLTVAMPCDTVGADILDTTGQSTLQFGHLEQENTWFELSPRQRIHFDGIRHVNSYLREEFHAVQQLLWKTGMSTLFGQMPQRSVEPESDPDACRIFGSLILNKVSGNFHITAGKSLNLPRGHIHISAFISEREYNFTHRIHRFSFGDPSPGIIHPLEGDEKITSDHTTLFQYFIEVVPTEVETFLTNLKTYQYSVKENLRPINHAKGSHGVPGIYFKYDMSALKVKVTEQRESFLKFLVRLAATVGGIYVTSGLINRCTQFIVNIVTCQCFVKKQSSRSVEKKITLLSRPDIIPEEIPTVFSTVDVLKTNDAS